MALTITKAYANLSILTEAHIDNFRTGLLTFFNTDKLGSGSFTSVALTSTHFANQKLTTADNSYLTFGNSSDGKFGLDSSKNLVFDSLTSGDTLTFQAVSETMVVKSTQVDVPGEIVIGAGGSGLGALYMLGKYRKPVLVWDSSSGITLENNSSTTHNTVLALPSRIISITEDTSSVTKSRKAYITTTANGYSGSHTGAAQGGMRSGVSLTNNNWYTVYGVRVRGGTDAGNRFIIVFDQLTPIGSNYAALDSHYGANDWVYLGLIRYGFGQSGSASGIVPFTYSNKGECWLRGNDSGATFGGVAFFQSTADADDSPAYTITDGTGSTDIPCDIVQMARFQLSRDDVSDWKARDSAAVVIWRGGWQEHNTSATHGHTPELPVYAGADFTQTRIGTGVEDKRVCMYWFKDSKLAVRRHGQGL